MRGFAFRLQREDGSPADPPTFEAAQYRTGDQGTRFT
jgi:hypothetical protein